MARRAPGGLLIKNPPGVSGDTGLIPWSREDPTLCIAMKFIYEPQLLERGSRAWEPCKLLKAAYPKAHAPPLENSLRLFTTTISESRCCAQFSMIYIYI